MRETWVQSLGWEELSEKEMATHSSTVAWKIPWTEKPGGLQSMESPRVGQDWATSPSLSFLSSGSELKASACNAGDLGSIPGSGRSPGEGNGNPLQYSCLENPMDEGAWWATVHGVEKSRTQLSYFTFSFTFAMKRGEKSWHISSMWKPHIFSSNIHWVNLHFLIMQLIFFCCLFLFS